MHIWKLLNLGRLKSQHAQLSFSVSPHFVDSLGPNTSGSLYFYSLAFSGVVEFIHSWTSL